MKKENLEMNETKEVIMDEDTKKMMKKFGVYRKIVLVGEGLFIFIAIAVLVLGLGLGVDIFANSTDVETDIPYSNENIEDINRKDILLSFVNEMSENKITENDFYEGGVTTITVVSEVIVIVVDYVVTLLMLNDLCTIFGNIEKTGTPFTDENVKKLNRINIFTGILFVFGTKFMSVSLIGLIVISAINYVFKYGCKLQKQADETI